MDPNACMAKHWFINISTSTWILQLWCVTWEAFLSAKTSTWPNWTKIALHCSLMEYLRTLASVWSYIQLYMCHRQILLLQTESGFPYGILITNHRVYTGLYGLRGHITSSATYQTTDKMSDWWYECGVVSFILSYQAEKVEDIRGPASERPPTSVAVGGNECEVWWAPISSSIMVLSLWQSLALSTRLVFFAKHSF